MSKLLREGYELEGRLFGGALSANRLLTAAKDAPIRKMIAMGRNIYNDIREVHGLPAVTDWTTPPTQLLQHLLNT
jgi:hypothetical protein